MLRQGQIKQAKLFPWLKIKLTHIIKKLRSVNKILVAGKAILYPYPNTGLNDDREGGRGARIINPEISLWILTKCYFFTILDSMSFWRFLFGLSIHNETKHYWTISYTGSSEVTKINQTETLAHSTPMFSITLMIFFHYFLAIALD